MILKSSAVSIKDENSQNLGKLKEYPSTNDLIKEQQVSSNDEPSSVHHRRDLDSLG